MGGWADKLTQLNRALAERLDARQLGAREERRRLLGRVGTIRPLKESEGASILQGRMLVGVDGSTHSYGGEFPYYLALVRAAAVPAVGEPEWAWDLHAPVAGTRSATAAEDALELRRCQTRLEAAVARAAADKLRPALLLMDGPLVRFDKEDNKSFEVLVVKALEYDTFMVGVIENVESSAIRRCLEAARLLPANWAGRWDRELLWGALDAGEVLEMRNPFWGSGDEGPLPGGTAGGGSRAIRRWFLRPGADPGAVALDFLDEQVEQAPQQAAAVADYLFTLTPRDGRGIPVWMDMVDRQVRIAEEELATWVNTYIDPLVRESLLLQRRHLRPRF